MSMNLTYDYYDLNGSFISMEEFEFQTPTSLTYEVLKIKNKNEQILCIENQLKKWSWDIDEINYTISNIRSRLNNPRVKLGMI